jgi:hypothetical protein
MALLDFSYAAAEVRDAVSYRLDNRRSVPSTMTPRLPAAALSTFEDYLTFIILLLVM